MTTYKLTSKLYGACQTRYPDKEEIVKLIEEGANINYVGCKCPPILSILRISREYEFVYSLIKKYDVDVNQTGTEGSSTISFLQVACVSLNRKLIELRLE